MISVPGAWRSVEECEDNVTLDDLITLVTKAREMRNQEREFSAAIAGAQINLTGDNNESNEDPYERAKRRAKERILKEQGVELTADEYEVQQTLGIQFREE